MLSLHLVYSVNSEIQNEATSISFIEGDNNLLQHTNDVHVNDLEPNRANNVFVVVRTVRTYYDKKHCRTYVP